jgi:hypothetical protein
MAKMKTKVDLYVSEDAIAFNLFNELLEKVMEDCNILKDEVISLREMSTQLVDVKAEVTANDDSH